MINEIEESGSFVALLRPRDRRQKWKYSVAGFGQTGRRERQKEEAASVKLTRVVFGRTGCR